MKVKMMPKAQIDKKNEIKNCEISYKNNNENQFISFIDEIKDKNNKLHLGRIVKLDRDYPLVRLTNKNEIRAEYASHLLKTTNIRPTIGDYVAVIIPKTHDKAIIEKIAPRYSKFIRKDPINRALPQVLAANFDLVIIAQPLEDINFHRLERELVLAHETNALVAIVLTKADLIKNKSEIKAKYSSIKSFIGKDKLLIISKKDRNSIDKLAHFLANNPSSTIISKLSEMNISLKNSGLCAIMIGKSGVGKSSLVNLLVGKEIQNTTPVRKRDGKGRHTTVTREIISLPLGGELIDMPGVRGLGLWDNESGIELAFSDIENLAQSCRFRDCSHQSEPGCAVRQAVETKKLSYERLQSYLRLKQENEQIKKLRLENQRSYSKKDHPKHFNSSL